LAIPALEMQPAFPSAAATIRVEDNHITASGSAGISVPSDNSFDNIIIKNSVSGQAAVVIIPVPGSRPVEMFVGPFIHRGGNHYQCQSVGQFFVLTINQVINKTMKTKLLIAGLTLLAISTLNSRTVQRLCARQPHTPGPPAPTMKSADQI